MRGFAWLLWARLLFASEAPSHHEAQPFIAQKLIPDLSVILDISWLYRDLNDHALNALVIPGLSTASDDADHRRIVYNAHKPFNFNYAEIMLSEQADATFHLDATFRINAHTVVAEEVYAHNREIPYGFTMRLGKFYSAFGRLNARHHHDWEFADMPLVNEAFLSPQGLNEIGLHIANHLGDTLTIGAEVFQGRNDAVFGYANISEEANVTTVTPIRDHPDAGTILVGFLKATFPLGPLHIAPGLSYLYGMSVNDETEDSYAQRGISHLYGLDLSVQWVPTDLAMLYVQGEWLARRLRAERTPVEGDTVHGLSREAVANAEAHSTLYAQEGFYLQGVLAMKSLRLGARYQNLYRNDAERSDHPINLPEYLERFSLMAACRLGAHSRVRVQFTHDQSRYDAGGRRLVDTVLTTLTVGFGPHTP